MNYDYFEIKIISQGDAGGMYFGLTESPRETILKDRQMCTYGCCWYSNDGTIFTSGMNWKDNIIITPQIHHYRPKFGLYDIIGCGIDGRRLFFTLNGQNLGTSAESKCDLKFKGLFPTVYFTGGGWEVEANFGSHTFVFDLRWHASNIGWCNNSKSKNIKLSEERMLAKIKATRGDGIVQATHQLKPTGSKVAYFEIKIARQHVRQSQYYYHRQTIGTMKVGIVTYETHDDQDLRLNRYWYTCSGLKCTEFKIPRLIGFKSLKNEETYGTTFGQHNDVNVIDVVGCGLTNDRNVFFTVNGVHQGLAFTVNEKDFNKGLYPAIELTPPWEATANFGKEIFAFDPINYCRNELYQYSQPQQLV